MTWAELKHKMKDVKDDAEIYFLPFISSPDFFKVDSAIVEDGSESVATDSLGEIVPNGSILLIPE